MVSLKTDTALAQLWFSGNTISLFYRMQKLHITQRHTFYEIMECQYSVKLENNFVWL